MKFSLKEWIALVLVLLAGITYLALDMISLYTPYNGGEKISIWGLKIKHLPLWMDLKLIFTSLLCFAGLRWYWKTKQAGWIITAAMLLNIIFLTAMVFLMAAGSNYWDVTTILATIILCLGIFSFTGLFKKEVRQKFKITNKSYLYLLLVYIGIIILFAL